MSAVPQKLKSNRSLPSSALTSTADITHQGCEVRNVPIGEIALPFDHLIGAVLVSVREHLESSESFVIQGWRSDLKGRPCGRRRTAVVTTEAGYAIRAI